MSDSSFAIVMFAIIGGALRVSTPFMFVALGECLTEKSGRVNRERSSGPPPKQQGHRAKTEKTRHLSSPEAAGMLI